MRVADFEVSIAYYLVQGECLTLKVTSELCVAQCTIWIVCFCAYFGSLVPDVPSGFQGYSAPFPLGFCILLVVRSTLEYVWYQHWQLVLIPVLKRGTGLYTRPMQVFPKLTPKCQTIGATFHCKLTMS